MTFKLRSKVWLYPGEAAWYFVTVSKKAAHDIKEMFGEGAKGFGSLPVEVTVGKTKWRTSIFPDSKSGSYVLPIKKEVRKKEHIADGTMLNYSITVRL